MIHLGLIGCGAWGRNYITAAADTGVADVYVYAGREWPFMLDEPIDAFVVATPPDTHEEIVTTLLEAGRPVMVEKPFALSAASAHRMAGVASKANVPLLINHQHLFAPAYEKFRSLVLGGDWSVRSAGGNLGPFRSYSALWDYGPHDVAMQLGLAEPGAGKVKRASKNFFGPREHGDDFILDMDLGCRIEGIIHVWNDRAMKTRFLMAENACHLVTYDALATVPSQLMMDGLPIETDSERPLQRAIRHFADAVRFGRVDWRFGGEIGVRVTEILERADAMTAARC